MPDVDFPTQWQGLPVTSISFEGVAVKRLTPLAGHLAQAEGKPLSREDVKTSLRQLFATGSYENIQYRVRCRRTGFPWSFWGLRARFWA